MSKSANPASGAAVATARLRNIVMAASVNFILPSFGCDSSGSVWRRGRVVRFIVFKLCKGLRWIRSRVVRTTLEMLGLGTDALGDMAVTKMTTFRHVIYT